ncbi:hypothetical protein Tco_0853378 [Tanacetum coccineum]
MSKEVGTPRYLSLVVSLKKVGDEAIHKELGHRMERAAITASRLEAEQDSGSGTRCQDTILGDVDAQTRKRACEKNQLMIEVLFGKKLKLVLAMAKANTVNGECSLQAIIDKKKVIITELSIRSDLHLKDAGGTGCLPTATIFEELARMGYEKPS